MLTKRVVVATEVSVTVDETKFTDEFMDEFRASFYRFFDIDDHIKHLAQLVARGIIDERSVFIEGYGPPKDMGIKVSVEDWDMDIRAAALSPHD